MEENTFVEIKMLFKKGFETEEDCEKEACEAFLVLRKIISLVQEHNQKSKSLHLNVYGLQGEPYPENFGLENNIVN